MNRRGFLTTSLGTVVAGAVGGVVHKVPCQLEHHAQHLSRVSAVLDQKDSTRRRTTLRWEGDRGGGAGRRHLLEPYRKSAPATFSIAGCSDRAPVQFHKPPDERQANSQENMPIQQVEAGETERARGKNVITLKRCTIL